MTPTEKAWQENRKKQQTKVIYNVVVEKECQRTGLSIFGHSQYCVHLIINSFVLLSLGRFLDFVRELLWRIVTYSPTFFHQSRTVLLANLRFKLLSSNI